MQRLISIAGPTASGKSTVARGVIEHMGASTHRFSGVLAGIAEELGLATDKASLQSLSTALRARLGEDVLARGMREWVKQERVDTIVIEGIRRKTDIVELERAAEETGRKWTLIFIDAPLETRFVRYKAREGDVTTLEEFKALETQECEVELPDIKTKAHAVIVNDGAPIEEVIKNALQEIGE